MKKKNAINAKVELNGLAKEAIQRRLSADAKYATAIKLCQDAERRRDFLSKNNLGNAQALANTIAFENEQINIYKNQVEEIRKSIVTLDTAATTYVVLALSASAPDGQAVVLSGLGSGPVNAPPEEPAPNAAGQNEGSDCGKVISNPSAGLRVENCRSDAIFQSATALPGGTVAFPNSVLRPPGITALLSGSESGGSVTVGLSNTFKRRLYSTRQNTGPDDNVQTVAQLGYSIGITAGSGVLYKSDPDKNFFDEINGKVTLSGSLFANFFGPEKSRDWQARAKVLTDTAVAACRKDQASGSSATPSTCDGQSLTNWVYAAGGKDKSLLRPELAAMADDLYFGSPARSPLWGVGLRGEISRPSYDYLLSADFMADPATPKTSVGKLNWSLTAFGQARLTKSDAPVLLSLIPGIGRERKFGYFNGEEEALFCPAVVAGAPFTTVGCKSLFATAPKTMHYWNLSVEGRMITRQWGYLPPLGFSPKLSYRAADDTLADRWGLDLPLYLFVDEKQSLGVGLQYSREWGGRDDTTLEELKAKNSVKLLFSKSFSLFQK